MENKMNDSTKQLLDWLKQIAQAQRPILSQADIEDYAARCANKAYEEAIHRATHGLVSLREIQDAA